MANGFKKLPSGSSIDLSSIVMLRQGKSKDGASNHWVEVRGREDGLWITAEDFDVLDAILNNTETYMEFYKEELEIGNRIQKLHASQYEMPSENLPTNESGSGVAFANAAAE